MSKLLTLFISIFLFFGVAISNTYALSTPIKINTSSNDVVYPVVTSDGNGYLHMAWQELTPGQLWYGSNPGIYYSKWNGDTWSTPLKISANTEFAEIPSVVTDSTNTLHVVWDDATYGTEGLQAVAYKTRSSAGTWSSIETLPIPSGTLNARSASIAIDGAGDPNVTFDSNTGGASDSIYWSKKSGGNWSTPQLISKDASSNDITDTQWSDLRSDLSGNLHVTYWSWSKGVFYRKYSAGSWSTPVNITTATDTQYTKMAVTPSGQVFVAWYQHNDTSIRERHTSSNVWQTEQTLSTSAQISTLSFPIIGVTTDSNNRAYVGWGDRNGNGKTDLNYRAFIANAWQSTQPVALNNDDAASPFVFPDKWDNQHFAWAQYNTGTGLWDLMYRVAEGTIQNVTTGGGTVTANPGGTTYATLVIPATALGSTQQIAIQVGPVPESVSPGQVTIPRSVTFRPHGLAFINGQTATSTVFYTNAEVGAVDETTLKPWYWDSTANGGSGGWVAQTGTVNTSANTIAVTLSHFSLYGISGKIVNTAFTNLQPNQVLNTKSDQTVEFQLTYADSSPFRAIIDTNDLTLLVKNTSGTTLKTYKYFIEGQKKSKEDNEKKQKEASSIVTIGDRFSVNVDVKKLGGNGDYAFEVLLSGNKVGELPFKVAK